MADTHSHPNYTAVFIWLAVLTAVEVGLGYWRVFPRPIYIAVLIALAGVKAALVAAYFMHLKFERRVLTVIAIFPVILLIILTLALVPDAFSFMRR